MRMKTKENKILSSHVSGVLLGAFIHIVIGSNLFPSKKEEQSQT